MKLNQKDKIRFGGKISILSPSECWLWLGGKQKSGHGVFSIKHKFVLAHRVSFYLANNYLPDIKTGRMIVHDCENSSCVNPKHLLDGTNKQNQEYSKCQSKHRKTKAWWIVKGATHPRLGVKHTEETKIKLSIRAKLRGWGKDEQKRTRSQA